jgi:hypothetical protein
MVFGVALAIAFFKLYGLITRPSVPRPVAVVVSQFAPGVEIGATVAEARHGVAAMSYVPHLGFIGVPDSHGPNLPNGRTVDFAQVRLFVDEASRVRPRPDPAKTRVDAVEVVTSDPGAAGDVAEAVLRLFNRIPRGGCLRTSDPERVRDVQLWTTPNERGGVAIISDHPVAGKGASAGVTMTNVIAFTGQFQGGRTLRGDYTDASCFQVLQPT